MDDLRQIFDKVIAGQTDSDKIAKLELCREYFTNPVFRKGLEDFAAQINGVA